MSPSGAVATVPLALDDFVPVVLAGVGALLLARAAGRRAPQVQKPAVVGALLVTAGGLCKAGWKLVLAGSGTDVPVIADLLFVLLAPGFALLAWSLLVARGSRVDLRLVGGVVAATAGLAAVLSAGWPLLVLAVLGATATSVLAIRLALDAHDSVAAVLFGVQLAMAFALVPLAGAGQSVAHQWWEQSLNTIGQGAFALAGWRLVRSRRTAPEPLRSTS